MLGTSDITSLTRAMQDGAQVRITNAERAALQFALLNVCPYRSQACDFTQPVTSSARARIASAKRFM